MMVLLQVACVLMLITGSALSLSSKKSLDAPKLDSLLQLLKQDLHEAYNSTSQFKDSTGRIFSHIEYSDGAGYKRGSIKLSRDKDPKMTVLNYLFKIEELPTPEQKYKLTMRSPAGGNQMAEENSSQEDRPGIIYVYRASPTLKSASMENNGKVFLKERFLSPVSGTKDASGIGDLEILPSQLVQDTEQAPEYLNDDINGPAMVYSMKPRARGYEQVWKKGQGLVVDREYELPESFNFRSAAISHRSDLDDDEKERPLHVYHFKPSIKALEVSRDLDGNYEISENYNSNMKHQEFDDDDEKPLYATHSKPSVQVMNMSSRDGTGAQG